MTLTEIAVHLPEPPSANVYYRNVGTKTLLSRAGRVYKLAVQAAWLKQGHGLKTIFPDGVVSVNLIWTRGRQSGDLDNRIKPTLDALKGLAFADDKQVIAIHAFRRDAKGQAGMQVIVTRTTEHAAFTSPTYSPPDESEATNG